MQADLRNLKTEIPKQPTRHGNINARERKISMTHKQHTHQNHTLQAASGPRENG
jgi:hypothetical protein